VLTGLRPDARSYAVELAGETRALALLPHLVGLVQRPRGVDPMTLVDALTAFGAEPSAQAALRELGKRGDEAGERARKAGEK
jgi:hypothetical protein